MAKTLTILISTYNDRVAQVGDVLSQQSPNVKYLVIHQITDNRDYSREVEYLKKSNKQLTYIPLNSKGVTKSRNLAIQATNTDYAIFADDDVHHIDDLYECVIAAFNEDNNATAITFQSASDKSDRLRKKFATKHKKHNRLSILNVGTIEIAFDVKRLQKSGVKFPEYMGAGTTLPAADEPVFLAQLIDRGHAVYYHPTIIVYHHEESSGMFMHSREDLLSRGVAFRQIFGLILAPLFIALFYLKNRSRMRQSDDHPLLTMYTGYKQKVDS